MRPYDPRDFATNPRKYELFKTATIARDIITHNGDDDIKAGTHVGIEYFRTAPNPLFRREEPVYRLAGTQRHLYANCFADFVL